LRTPLDRIRMAARPDRCRAHATLVLTILREEPS
jgi:hypothetical protein